MIGEPQQVKASILRQFGFAASVLAVAGAYWFGGLTTSTTTGIWLAFAAVFAVLAAVAPLRLRLPFVLLSAVTAPIGWVISHLVLGIIYFGVVTPIGWALRATGRASLRTEIDRDAGSYWEEREQPGGVEDYLRQS